MSGPRRNPEIQVRLDRWALWRTSGSGGSGGSWLAYLVDLAAGRRVHDDGQSYAAVVPCDEIECSRTDEAVKALPLDLRQAVSAWHCATSGTLEEVARRLGVVRGTLHRRLCQADLRIAEFLVDRRNRNI